MADDFLNSLPIGYSIRLGRISKVEDSFVEVEFFDRFSSNAVRCPLPHLYPGRGGGVLIGVEKDTIVVLASGPMEKWYIVGFVPNLSFYGNLDNVDQVRFDETSYPALGAGEIVVKGTVGQYISLTNDGSLSFDAGAGNRGADLELSPFANGLFLRTDNAYRFSEAGREIEGVIRRDVNAKEQSDELGSVDFLSGESYEELLTTIGRSPVDEIQTRTTVLSKETVRNPALIEKREIVYEYADSFGVQGFDKELAALEKLDINNLAASIEALQVNPSARENRRTDILDLNLRNYNHLIERVQGTVVDIYGNILDINRNVIKLPDVELFNTHGSDRENLRKVYDYLRRSIKYHFEINARKAISSTEPSSKLVGIGKEHSRFSLDIDGEGFTKINIPATSETGNIPVLSRYFVSRDQNNKDNGSFRDPQGKDIRVAQFGAKSGGSFAGATISNKDYIPTTVDGNTVTVGTAYHDMSSIVSSIFGSGKFGGQPILKNTITNKIGDTAANAGGRSLHLNLDGSMEMSIGSDTLDGKSLMMDLEGCLISFIGRDLNGRSIVHQSDGDVLIEIGGSGAREGDSEDRPGRLEIHLKVDDKKSQKIVIDEDGITIEVNGNAVFSSTGDMTISAGARLLLNGEMIFLHGTHDEDIKGTRAIYASERYLLRNGNIVM